ncbi:hypothetical protein KHA80_15870 [Anaerobacillus sp. HL2]|nr:hypothetical protein KHA80_15870 [Anaerobacillus sp. HL2]
MRSIFGDFSIDETKADEEEGKYKAMIERGTIGPKDTVTGLDYLRI